MKVHYYKHISTKKHITNIERIQVPKFLGSGLWYLDSKCNVYLYVY